MAAIVSGIAPELPVAVVAAGPIVIQDPAQTLSCPPMVSYHCSPETGLLGALELNVIVVIVLNAALAVPLVTAVLTDKFFVAEFHQSCPGNGAAGAEVLLKFSINRTMFWFRNNPYPG